MHEQAKRLRVVCRRARPAEERAVSEFLNYLINGTLSGECPCTAAGGTPQQNVSTCADDSAYYYVVVERTSGALTCDSYQIELSNGVYDTP